MWYSTCMGDMYIGKHSNPRKVKKEKRIFVIRQAIFLTLFLITFGISIFDFILLVG